MEHVTASTTGERKDTSLVIGKGMLFKLDLLTNAAVDDDAIRFVSSHKSKEKLKSSSEGHKEESNEPDYYEDEDHLEEARRGNWRNNNWNNKSSFLIMQFIRTTHP